MAARILDFDPVSGIKTLFDYCEQTDTTTIGRTQDCEQILRGNELYQKDADFNKQQLKADLPHVAKIPAILIEKWLNEEGINIFDRDHWPAVRSKLNSLEFQKIRTSIGRV